MERERTGQYSLKIMALCLMILLVVTGIGALNLIYFYEVEKSLMEQSKKELKEENDKALFYLSSVVEKRFEWLEVVAAFCDAPDGSGEENWWRNVEAFQREGSRFGIADNKGTIYFGNHESMDITDRRYYKEVMEGKKSISRVLDGDFKEKDGIVLAVPIIRDGQVLGAACVEYTTAELGMNLNKTEENQYGENIVFTKEGLFVAAGQETGSFGSVYELLRTLDCQRTESVEQMKAEVVAGKSGYLTYFCQGKKQIIYYQPVGILDWTVASIKKTEDYEGTLLRIRTLSLYFVSGSTIMLISALLLIIGVLHIRKKESEQAKKDFLTGVYTRETAGRLVELGLKRKGKAGFYACMFLDIDDFKKINDTYGHKKGDQVLAEAGRILINCTRTDDVIVRFGGDEFLIWLSGLPDRKQPEKVAKRILAEFERLDSIHASIGIAMVKKGETDSDAVLNRADEALYEAKKKGKNQFSLYK